MGSFEEELEEIIKEAIDRDRRIQECRKQAVIFLLGPGYPREELKKRRDLKKRLQSDGIKVIVMEDIPQWKSTLSEKFLGIIKRLKPDLFIAVFSKDGQPHGVTFELGFLTALLGLEGLFEKLRYCIELGVDEPRLMTAYIREQLPVANSVRYEDDEALFRSVRDFVDKFMVKKGWAAN